MSEHIVLVGLKSCGKSSVGTVLAAHMNYDYLDTDQVLEALYLEQTGRAHQFPEIYQLIGERAFRDLERQAIKTSLK